MPVELRGTITAMQSPSQSTLTQGEECRVDMLKENISFCGP